MIYVNNITNTKFLIKLRHNVALTPSDHMVLVSLLANNFLTYILYYYIVIFYQINYLSVCLSVAVDIVTAFNDM